jgi:Cu2+-exporting ATPase
MPETPSALLLSPNAASVGVLPDGVSLHTAADLALLDAPQEWSAFSRPDPQHKDCWESSVVVEGMHCAACSLVVEDLLKGVPGVISAQVGAASRRAKVVWSAQHVAPSQWMGAVQGSGYRIVPANDTFLSERRKQETRQALWRWLVAGLCMMQVMMYAYPAYVAKPGDLSAEMEQLLRWASWVLTLPVMLFSCGPFFKNALRDVAQARISMDLPVSLGIVITFAVSTAGTFEPLGIFGNEVYFDSLTMFVFFLLTGRWMELRLRDRTAGALEALMNRLPDSVERLQGDGRYERIPVRRLLVGDTVRVHPGETFAADGVVTWGETLVDEALLTGESHPLPRGPGATVLCGSHNLSSTVGVQIQSIGQATRFSQIVALMETACASKPHIAQLADRLAKPFLIAVLLAAAGACAWWWPQDPGHALMVAVAVLVVTCPCALSLATPTAMLASAGTLARAGVLVRRLHALEALAKVDTFVFDKTGTLTMDAMQVGAVEPRAGWTRRDALALADALAQHSLHPASQAISRAAQEEGVSRSQWQLRGITEVAGQGVQAQVWDGLGVFEANPLTVRLGSARFCDAVLTGEPGTRVYLADDKGVAAHMELTETLRPQAAKVIAALAAEGVDVLLLSGDQPASVARVAQQLGITQAQGGCSPDDKLVVLRQLQSQGRHVAMVGDGLNDGPVLAGAHVSFALGKAVPLAQAQADFVILGDELTGVLHALRLSRSTLAIVRQNLGWALAYNAVCVPLAVVGWLPAWLAGLGMATSSLVVVLNALRLSRNIGLARPQ